MMLKLIWRNLWRNMRRTTITAASIAFAVVFAILMQSYRIGVFNNMIKNVVGYYSGYIQIHQFGYWNEQVLDNCFEVDAETLQKVQSIPEIREIVPRIETFILISKEDKTKGCMLVGTDATQEDKLTQLKSKIVRGNYFENGANSIVLGLGLSERLQVSVNDTVVLFGQGYHGLIAAGKYKITGIVELPSPPMNNSFAYMPLPLAQKLLSAENRITSLSLKLNTTKTIPPIQNVLQSKLGAAYEVMSWEEMMPELATHIKADTISFSVFIGILYLIIAFGFFGTILIMTTERKNEFGMLIAIGMKKSTLQLVLLGETILLTSIGVLVGMLISLPIVVYLSKHPIRFSGELAEAYQQYGFEPILPTELVPSVFYVQALVVLVMALLVGLYPLFHIGRLTVITALKK